MGNSRADNGDETVLTVTGKLDAGTDAEVRQLFHAVVSERRSPVTLDLSWLTHLEETSVGTLAVLRAGMERYGGTLRVIGTNGQPQAILRLLRWDDWV